MHLGLGPFAVNAARYEAGDFTWPINFLPVKVLVGRGSPEVDPWGFLLPFDPWVWETLLAFLMLLSVISFVLTKFLEKDFSREVFAKKYLYFTSIMLRQCEYASNYVLRLYLC